MNVIFRVLTGLILSFVVTVGASANKLPVEAFSALPEARSAKLSPDGLSVAMLATPPSAGGDTVLMHYDLKNNTRRALTKTDNKTFTIKWIRWANNQHILVSARFPTTRNDVPTTETRLLVVDTKTRAVESLFSKGFLNQQKFIPQFMDNVVDLLPDDPDHILVGASFNYWDTSEVYKVRLSKRKVKRVERSKSRIDDWVTDRAGNVRIAIYFEDTTYKVLHRAIGSTKWQTLWEYEALSDDRVSPLGFDGDDNTLFIRAYHEGFLAVFSVDLSADQIEKRLVFADGSRDVTGGLLYSSAKNKVVGIRGGAAGGIKFFDDKFAGLQRGLDKAMPDTINKVLALGADDNRYLLLQTSDIESGTYMVGDRKQRTLEPLAYRYSQLAPEFLSEKKSIKYSARDGVDIRGYLTVPKASDGKNLPTIIFPHGGPISYSGSGFDYWTQYFANEGYAVLQMNFRGSSGYGYDFMSAGFDNWGLEMQRDVEDGTRWLIEQGIADRGRICIIGASYGGYAALMGAAKNGDLYQCAVSFAGVTDLAKLVQNSRRYTNYEVAKEQLGAGYKKLSERSPLTFAEDIDVPVLLAHGTKDRSVRVLHSQRMYKKLNKLGKDVVYIEQEDGDHYLSRAAHRHQFFKEMDVFLDKHLQQ